MTKTQPIIKFNTQLPHLSENEKKVLELLTEAGELIVPLYEAQENSRFPGANFYPHDLTREEIEQAANEDPQILSPYTVVQKKGKKLVAVPYHQIFAPLLKPVADKLRQAAKITENKSFSERLQLQARALLEGNYEEATISWMTMEPYILDIVIGPIERYDDKLFFTKTSYQAWVGVMDSSYTESLTEYKDMILTFRRKVINKSERVDYYDKVQVRVDDVVLLSGLIARTLFAGVNLPNEPWLIEKYGSEVTIFKQTNEIRHEKNLAVFNNLFSPQFRNQFTPKDLESGSLYSAALHELAHSYLRYRDAEKRLQDLFPVIDELGATVLGIKVCGSLLLKDIITQKQLESIMLASVLRAFYNVLEDQRNVSKYHYNVGWAIFLNYLLTSGAIKEAGGISWPNFMKIFLSLDELASIIERILSQGTREDAVDFISQYGDMKHLQRFKGIV